MPKAKPKPPKQPPYPLCRQYGLLRQTRTVLSVSSHALWELLGNEVYQANLHRFAKPGDKYGGWPPQRVEEFLREWTKR